MLDKNPIEWFRKKSHFWGRLTIIVVILISVLFPLYLSFGLGLHPGWSSIIAGIIGYASFIGVMWVIEPITYFPVLGIAGTYISFLSGNIANLCLPCSSAAQEAVGVEPGSDKAEVVSVLGITVASITSKIFVVLSVLLGNYVLYIIPASIQQAFAFVLPAIFGAVLGQFAYKVPKYGIIALATGIIVYFSFIPSYFKVLVNVILIIGLLYYVEIKRKEKLAVTE